MAWSSSHSPHAAHHRRHSHLRRATRFGGRGTSSPPNPPDRARTTRACATQKPHTRVNINIHRTSALAPVLSHRRARWIFQIIHARALRASHAFVPVAVFTRLARAPRRAPARALSSHTSREYFSTRAARRTHLGSLARRCAGANDARARQRSCDVSSDTRSPSPNPRPHTPTRPREYARDARDASRVNPRGVRARWRR